MSITSALHSANRSSSKVSNPHIPGEAGVWIFILGDMLIFAIFFAVFVYYQQQQPLMFAESQATLTIRYGLINTVLLLTSSWFVIIAIEAVRRHLYRMSALFFSGAFVCGAGFSLVKFIEYKEKIQAGYTMVTNDFYMFYYIFTGIHFLHVVIGMALLGFVIVKVLKRNADESSQSFYEVGASYWHMVDVLWIVLFPLIYLMGS